MSRNVEKMSNCYLQDMLRLIRNDILFEYDTFETIPIVNNPFIIKNELKDIDGESITRCLVSVSISILSMAKELGHNKFYLAIQLDLDDYLEDGFVIPQIIVTNKPEIIKCFNNIPVVAFEDCGINNILSSVIGIEHFRVHLSEPPENNQDGFSRELILELR